MKNIPEDLKRTRAKRRFKAPELFEQLRADILACRLVPGTRLMFKDLHERYGAGVSQLRESLMRLTAERLALVESRRGFCVAPVSREELVDIIRVRTELEVIAIRDAVQRGDLRWEANILACLHEVTNFPVFHEDGTLHDGWNQRNRDFHNALYAACGSPVLLELCDDLRERYGRYRRLWAQYGNTPAATSTDHERLARAAIARHADQAADLVRMHFTRVTAAILDNWSAVEKALQADTWGGEASTSPTAATAVPQLVD
jgi:DNA-binding GntR family transcriptional regulator